MATVVAMGLLGACDIPQDEQNKDTPRTAVPEAMVGQWQDPTYLTQHNIDLYDPASGLWTQGIDPDSFQAGSGIRFTATGEYVWSGYLTAGFGGCRSRYMDYQRGTVAIEGSTVSFYPHVRRESYEGGCNSASDFDRDGSLEPHQATWGTGLGDDGRSYLVLQAGDSTWYYAGL